MTRNSKFLSISSLLGFIFLYAPILSLIIYSFNKSKLVTVWGGWSVKWYVELFSNQQIIDAALVSLNVAFITATLSVILGVLAGYVPVSYRLLTLPPNGEVYVSVIAFSFKNQNLVNNSYIIR